MYYEVSAGGYAAGLRAFLAAGHVCTITGTREYAELAAQRRGPELVGLLSGTIELLAAEQDPVARQRHALAYWDHVVDAADSIVFRLMYNSMRATYEPALPALSVVMAPEVGRPEAYRRLAEVIENGDADAARAAAIDLLAPATSAILAALEKLENQQ